MSICASSTGSARRVPTSHSRVISSSAFRARATAILPIRWRLSTRSDTPRPILSNTARVPAPRRGVRGAGSETVKSERLEALQQLLNAQQFAFNKATEGRVMDVLIERRGRARRAGRRAQPLHAVGQYRGRGRPCRQHFVLPDHRGETELNHRGGRMTGRAW